MTYMDELAQRSGIPESRRFVVPWTEIESDLSIRFPIDYRNMIEHFGPGTFADVLDVYTPGVENSLLEIRAFTRSNAEAIRSRLPKIAASYPYPIYPDEGYILPAATFVDGERVYWLTGSADSDRWPLLLRLRGRGWHRFEMSLTEFILKLFGNALSIESLDYWFDEFPRFIPDRSEYQGVGERLDPISYFAA